MSNCMSSKALFELEDILPVLPHRPPFLFVERVLELEPYRYIVAERTLRPDEPQFKGHFPGRPIMPGVLVTEALAQASGLLLGLSERASQTTAPGSPKMFFLAATNVKFTHPAAPGEVLVLRAEIDKQFSGLYRFNVEAAAGRNVIARGTLTLALAGQGQTS